MRCSQTRSSISEATQEATNFTRTRRTRRATRKMRIQRLTLRSLVRRRSSRVDLWGSDLFCSSAVLLVLTVTVDPCPYQNRYPVSHVAYLLSEFVAIFVLQPLRFLSACTACDAVAFEQPACPRHRLMRLLHFSLASSSHLPLYDCMMASYVHSFFFLLH